MRFILVFQVRQEIIDFSGSEFELGFNSSVFCLARLHWQLHGKINRTSGRVDFYGSVQSFHKLFHYRQTESRAGFEIRTTAAAVLESLEYP